MRPQKRRLSTARVVLITSVLAGLSTACGQECPPIISAALSITVKEAAIEQGLPGARVTVRGGNMQILESTVTTPEHHQFPVFGGPGPYVVTATKTGYRSWERAGIEVESGDCDLLTKEVIVAMERD